MSTARQNGLRAGFVSALAAAAILVMAVSASAQAPGRIVGTVSDGATMAPLSGVQVFIPGTSHGTLTTNEGRFLLLNVPPGTHTVRALVIGYAAQEATVTVGAGETATLAISLQVSAVALDEVVVTGQGRETSRREIGNTIATVNTEQLTAAPVTSMSELLQGRSAGMTIMTGGGYVGQGSKIILRGAGSFAMGVQPIIYVDGVRIDNSDISGVWTGGTSWSGIDDINPADIERVEVIKGAAASTLYGTEASAGVIQIFTKKGRGTERGSWTYSGEYGVSNTPEDWWNVSLYAPWFYDNYVNSGNVMEHQLSTQGGQEGFSYFASGTYRTQDGMLPGNGEDYYSFRGNLQLFPREDLVVSFQTGFVQREVAMPQDANNIYGYGINALAAGSRGLFMPVEEISLIEANFKSDRFTGGMNATWNPSEDFGVRFTVGADVFHSDNTEFQPYGGNSFNPQGRKDNYRRDATSLNIDLSMSYGLQITDNVKSDLSAGFQAYKSIDGRAEAFGQDFPAPGLSTVGAAATTTGWEWRRTQKSAGFFIQDQIGFNDLLFLTVGARADAHSAFGSDYPYEIYPKAAVSYVISEHGFFPGFVEQLRLRAAYGTAGQQPGAFDAVRTWAPASALEGVAAVTPENIGNPDLAPEKSHEIEVGFDADLFTGRLGIEATYYNQRTEGALIPVRYPPSAGFLNTQLENVGEIQNRGLELSVNGTLLELGDLRWHATANMAFMENEIIDLGEEEELYVHWTQANRRGYPLGAFFGDRFVTKDGKAVEVKDQPWLLNPDGSFQLDADGKKIPNPNNEGYIGPPMPTRTFQFSNTIDYGRFHLRAMLDHSGGNFTESATVRWVARQTIPQDNAEVGSEYWGKSALSVCHQTDDPAILAFCETPWPAGGRGNVVMPADFWKLRELTLSYDIPAGFVGKAGFRTGMVYFTGRNLWRSIDTWAMEAEANYSTNDLSNQDYFITPVPRTFTLGLRLGF
ncbi:MAG: SusC/RagA family TonB-linked outer membrane protein [Gemmatimonadota bacterium]